MASLLELASVEKSFPQSQVRALHGVDLRIDAGEFVSIMGPSGSGKSTLLNLIAALDIPTAGSIRIDGENIGTLTDDQLTLLRRTKIGIVFQFFNLLPTLNAMDNVLLPVLLSRRATEEDHARARGLLVEVGLGDRTTHRISQLSGGQMQRVAIARALMIKPRLLLADEPTGNLDSAIGKGILRLLREICDRHGTTIVLVTHDRSAADFGHRLVRLLDGRIVADERITGSPDLGAA
jgi:putative ABC transport system ATP-binding protein